MGDLPPTIEDGLSSAQSDSEMWRDRYFKMTTLCNERGMRMEELERERDFWKEEARRYAENSDFWRRKVEELERENAALMAKLINGPAFRAGGRE